MFKYLNLRPYREGWCCETAGRAGPGLTTDHVQGFPLVIKLNKAVIYLMTIRSKYTLRIRDQDLTPHNSSTHNAVIETKTSQVFQNFTVFLPKMLLFSD